MARRFTEAFPRLANMVPTLAPERTKKDEETVRSAIRALVVLSVFFIIQYWRLGLNTMAWAVGCASLFSLALLWGISRYGRPRLFGEMALATLFCLLIGSNYYSGGFYHPNFCWFLVVPVGAAVVLGPWIAFRWTLLTFLCAVAFWSLEEIYDVHFESQIPEAEQAFQALANRSTAILSIGILVWVFVRSHARAEGRALAAQKALLKERERLRVLAHFDSLTTLPNRNTFEQSLARCLAKGQPVALVYVDIDRFKDVNDAFGYALGDALLIEVGKRFAEVVYDGPVPIHLALERYDDGPLLARRGGDEFVVLLRGATGAEAAAMGQKLVRCLRRPVDVASHRLHVAASVGIALGPTDGSDVEALVRSADIALSRVKQRGTGGVDFFEEKALESVRRRVLVETALRDAIENDELRVLFQPLFSMDGEIVGAEALMRWESSMLGSVSPAEFIPIAERSGQMRDLGRWVLARACEEAATWPDPLRISVNVSVAQLRGGQNLVATVRDVLAETGFPPERLELEITESLLADDAFTRVVLGELRELGISLALDDFGTGFSSLGVLRQLPVDRLKIDRSFVQSMHTDDGDAALVRTIVAMGRELGLHVLAEGVELGEQLEALREIGCHEVQGYHLGKPLTPGAFRERVGRAPETRASGTHEVAPSDTDTGKVIPISGS
ncbi:MAG: EAL domain-containing protein [Myxococcota bacterium]